MMCDPFTDVERAILQVKGKLPRRLVVIAGPSGVGKNTIIKELLASHPRIMDRVRTYTTRPRRDDEVDGEQYHFVTPEQFMKMAEDDLLMEADPQNKLGHDVYGTKHSYSMPADIFESVSPEAHIIIAEVDVVGADRLKERFPDCVRIFITAPPHELLERIRSRPDGDMSSENLGQRMQTAKQQIEAAKDFDYVVYNTEGHLTQTVSALRHILHAERMRVVEGFDLAGVLPAGAFDATLASEKPHGQ